MLLDFSSYFRLAVLIKKAFNTATVIEGRLKKCMKISEKGKFFEISKMLFFLNWKGKGYNELKCRIKKLSFIGKVSNLECLILFGEIYLN